MVQQQYRRDYSRGKRFGRRKANADTPRWRRGRSVPALIADYRDSPKAGVATHHEGHSLVHDGVAQYIGRRDLIG
jgi:hypothetical protein